MKSTYKYYSPCVQCQADDKSSTLYGAILGGNSIACQTDHKLVDPSPASNIKRIHNYIEKLENCLSCMDLSLENMKQCIKAMEKKEGSHLETLCHAQTIEDARDYSGVAMGSSVYPGSHNNYSIERVVNLSLPSSTSYFSQDLLAIIKKDYDAKNNELRNVSYNKDIAEKITSFSTPLAANCKICAEKEDIPLPTKDATPSKNEIRRKILTKRLGKPKSKESSQSKSLQRTTKEDEEPEDEYQRVKINDSTTSIYSDSEHLVNSLGKKPTANKWSPILVNKNDIVEPGAETYSLQEGLTSVDSILLLRQKNIVPGRNISYYNVATSYNEGDFKNKSHAISSVDSLILAKEKRSNPSQSKIRPTIPDDEDSNRAKTTYPKKAQPSRFKSFEEKEPAKVLTESSNSSNYFNSSSTDTGNEDITYINVVKSHKKESEETVKSKVVYKVYKR